MQNYRRLRDNYNNLVNTIADAIRAGETLQHETYKANLDMLSTESSRFLEQLVGGEMRTGRFAFEVIQSVMGELERTVVLNRYANYFLDSYLI